MVEITERVLRLAQSGGRIGVDLDGTLFTYNKWVGWNVFGEPIEPMVHRIKVWLAAGVDVRIVTARIGLPVSISYRGLPCYDNIQNQECKITGVSFSNAMMWDAIRNKLASIGLPRLPVQCFKDVNMIELWDDRVVQVVANTGRTLAEEHEAELTALHGKQFQEGVIDV